MRRYASGGKLTNLMDVHPGTQQPDQAPEGNEGASAPMTVPRRYRPVKSADVLELDMGDGLILYNHDSSLVHHLNPSAALVWQLCDGTATVGELARDIAAEYELEAVQVEEQVASVIAEFDALDLIRDSRKPLARTDGHQ